MKTLFNISLALLLAVMVLLGGILLLGAPTLALAAPPTGAPGYQILTIPISSVTGTTTAIWKIKAPWNLRVLGFHAVNQAQSGTVTYDLQNSSGVSLLSSAITGSTVVTDATLTTSSSTLNIAQGSTLQINTAGTGSSTNVSINIETVRH